MPFMSWHACCGSYEPMKRQKQKDKLEELVRDLESELSERKKQVDVIEETNKRLLEAERICQQLVEENHQLREEIAGWKERVVKSEETQRRMNLLRHELEEVQAEDARVIGQNREMQQRLHSGRETGPLGSAVEIDSSNAMTVESEAHSFAGAASGPIGPDNASHGPGGKYSKLQNHAANFLKASRTAWNSLDRRWQIGTISAGILVLIIAGTITFKSQRSEAPISREPIEFTPEPATVKNHLEPIPEPRRRVEPRIRGAFQTVRPTQVFSEPTEASNPIVNIGKGTRVNVVDSRNGWLEIRSKHGRPPGFIRQETAVRINSN